MRSVRSDHPLATNGGFAPGRVTDNGPLRAGKGTLYEGGVRAAAFAAWDGHIPSGSRVKAPLHIVDWHPTLLKLAGAPIDQRLPVDGRDAWPSITAGRPSPHEEILLNAAPTSGALRAGDWKLVLSGGAGQGKAELFHLSQDIGEKNDVAAQHADKVQDLRARYDRFASEAVPPRSSERGAN